ncbi:MAG: hypothetical protein A2Y34_07110 [Spirochaetes bacterium GWC1_27_15]|nr:MAG: hypothetical protein A2Y34_07110 [Spirochaetes bacterium GWC1_27_15]
MIISFEKIVEKFISRHGIRAVVLKTNFINESECHLSLYGGYSTSVKVIEDKLYQDGALYCKVEELFG